MFQHVKYMCNVLTFISSLLMNILACIHDNDKYNKSQLVNRDIMQLYLKDWEVKGQATK